MQPIGVSVIIPLEYHRGQVLQCAKSWARGQSFPRDRYQIVLAVPRDFPDDLAPVEALLAPQDVIKVFPFRHDMQLVAAAVQHACGEILLFTESHVLAEPHTVGHAYQVLLEHPEWAGFSCPSIPIVHNLTSIVEAEMYGRDIAHNLGEHPWLKVLDQFFVIRKHAYLESGGVEPEFGHFAEWLFAARLRLKGLTVGHDKTPAVRHFYSGQLHDLKVFTLDFAEGEIRFAAEHAGDPRHQMFAGITELEEPRQWSWHDAWAMVRLRFNLLLQHKSRQPSSAGRVTADLIAWTAKAILGIRATRLLACLDVWVQEIRLRWYLRLRDRERAGPAFRGWVSRLRRKARLDYLRRHPALTRQRPPEEARVMSSGRWQAGATSPLDHLGFHDLETCRGTRFRWSSHCAAVFLPLPPGEYQIKLEWLDVRPLCSQDAIEFYLQDRPLPRERVTRGKCSAELRFAACASGATRVAWSVDPFAAKADERLLGLPLYAVSWRPAGN
jgi:hypothetical protein